jgi:CDP-diacylglycerol--serine O-phosphatidyltransferase
MATLSFLMISTVPYPVMPPINVRTVRGIFGLIILVGGVGMLIFGKLEYFFPMTVAYVAFGLLRGVFLGLLDRRQGPMRPGWFPGGNRETDLPVMETVGESEDRSGQPPRRRRRRRHRPRDGDAPPAAPNNPERP